MTPDPATLAAACRAVAVALGVEDAQATAWARAGVQFKAFNPKQPRDAHGERPLPGSDTPAAARALAWSRAGTTLAVKTGGQFTEELHPRDAHGRFIKIGGRVRISLMMGGGEGIVEAINPNGQFATVKLDAGGSREFDKRFITVLDPGAPDGPPPRPYDKDAERLAGTGVPTVDVPTVAVPPLTTGSPRDVHPDPSGESADYQQVLDQQTKAWGSGPPPTGFSEALLTYTGAEFSAINDALRSGDPGRYPEIAKIDAGFSDARAVAPANVVVYRGVSNVDEIFADLAEGDEFTDLAYVSTSFDKGTTVQFGDTVRINIAAGQRAILVDALHPDGLDEQELLLPRGTKFRVVKADWTDATGWDIELDVASTPDRPTPPEAPAPKTGKPKPKPNDPLPAPVDGGGLEGEAAHSAPPLSAYSDLPDDGLAGVPAEKIYQALNEYMAQEYSPTNGALRAAGGKTTALPAADKARVKALDAVLKNSVLSDDIVVYRGLRDPDRTLKDAWGGADLTGASWTDHAYLSTSTDRAIAERFLRESGTSALVRITVPKGTRAIGLSRGEKEVLLDRGGTYTVTADRVENGTRTLDVTATPNPGATPAPATPTPAPQLPPRPTKPPTTAAGKPATKKPAGKKPGDRPRDAHDRLVEPGAAVRVFGGGDGTVRGHLADGTLDVELADGQHRAVPNDWLAVTARPDGGPPTDNPELAAPNPPDPDRPAPPTFTPDIAPGAGWPTWPPPSPDDPALTPGQAIAAKYWKTLPTGTRDELQTQLGGATPAAVPSIDEYMAQGMSAEAAAKAHQKAEKAAYMKAYDQRLKLRAALDTMNAREEHLPDPLAGTTPPTADQARLMSDAEIAEAIGRFGDDEHAIEVLIAEMERRDDPNADPGTNTAEQDRIDQLIAGGASLDEAIAQVYQVDVENITAANNAGAVTADRQPGETVDQAARRHYDEWVDMQAVAAENDTRGNLLSPAGKAAKVDPATLFSGPAATARKYASEELKRWWAEPQHPRRTFTEFKADTLGRATDRQLAGAIQQQGAGRDFGL